MHASCAHNHEHTFLYVNKNPSHVTHEHTVHECTSLITCNMPASMSNMQVKEFTQVRRVTHRYVHLSILVPYGIYMVSITASLVCLLPLMLLLRSFYRSDATVNKRWLFVVKCAGFLKFSYQPLKLVHI